MSVDHLRTIKSIPGQFQVTCSHIPGPPTFFIKAGSGLGMRLVSMFSAVYNGRHNRNIFGKQ